MSAIAPPDPMRSRAEGAPPRAAQLGMWIFLGTEVLFFGGLFVVYAYGRTHWPHGFAAASRRTDVVIGTINTAVLLTSSAVVAFAVACAEEPGHRRSKARALWATAVLGVVFVSLKAVEYSHEWSEQLFPLGGFALADTPGAELFWVLYFVMTGLHAVHLTIGIVGISTFAWATGRKRSWPTAERIDTMALYWHFVDVVWILLYPLIYLVERHP
ncbi:MAG: cytochrome c oxidase subunit 3 [Rhizobacter sp.]|nr:cytochrome c oxidase subunit 3 [Rhizobacter sp.]